MTPMFCESCHRVERDPIMLDVETCSQCGGYLACMDGDGEDAIDLPDDEESAADRAYQFRREQEIF